MPTTYAIPDGRTVMAATTFNGITGGTQTITNTVNGVGFQPDFVWMKLRSGVQDHFLIDSVRGSSNYVSSNTTAAEVTGATAFLTSFNSNGWSLGSGGYGNGVTVVGWNWKAGGTAVSNTAGSITSSVSANTTAGFSVVTYTGTGVAATIGHGLGVAPSMMITKNRTSGAQAWHCYHASLGNSAVIFLNTTAAQSTGSADWWNNTTPTSSVFSVGTGGATNGNTQAIVAYCFAAVAGYSAFGSFTGNGSADGPFVYTGFRPAFVMAKLSSATGDWNMVDDMRQTYNDASGNPVLRANLSSAEEDVDTMQGQMDILSNGFKLRSNNSSLNASGGTIIYAAFAKSPFKYANAR